MVAEVLSMRLTGTVVVVVVAETFVYVTLVKIEGLAMDVVETVIESGEPDILLANVSLLRLVRSKGKVLEMVVSAAGFFVTLV